MKAISLVLAGFAMGASVFFTPTPEPIQLDLRPTSIRPLLEGMRYEAKDLGENNWEVVVSKGGLDVPIAVGLSSSGRKLWLTTYLSEVTAKLKADPDRLIKILEKNFEIQPTHFFISQTSLKAGMALDNRGIGAVVLKRELEKMAEDVAASKSLWEGAQE